jgi:hypothetical protein
MLAILMRQPIIIEARSYYSPVDESTMNAVITNPEIVLAPLLRGLCDMRYLNNCETIMEYLHGQWPIRNAAYTSATAEAVAHSARQLTGPELFEFFKTYAVVSDHNWGLYNFPGTQYVLAYTASSEELSLKERSPSDDDACSGAEPIASFRCFIDAPPGGDKRWPFQYHRRGQVAPIDHDAVSAAMTRLLLNGKRVESTAIRPGFALVAMSFDDPRRACSVMAPFTDLI